MKQIKLSPMAAVVCMAAMVSGVQAQTTAAQLMPVSQRTSDASIHADYETYAAMQGRIRQINERGTSLRDYHLSKAQCWLDVSLQEYTRNDRSAFPQATLEQSEKLVAALEQKHPPLPMETALVNDAARLRPDLWERVEALKRHAGFQCAGQQVACAEVELVHAGNEFNQQQWRHAKPYIQMAEDKIGDATELAQACGTSTGAAQR